MDYFIARKGNIHIPSLYDGTPKGLYWFKSGVNWLGVAAWLGAVVLGLPGLVGQYQPEAVSQAAVDMYSMGWLLTFVAAFVIYFILIKIWPPQIYPAGFDGMPVHWEYLCKEGRDGFFDGERDGTFVDSPSRVLTNDDAEKEKEIASTKTVEV